MNGQILHGKYFKRHNQTVEENNSALNDIDNGVIYRFINEKYNISLRQAGIIRCNFLNIVTVYTSRITQKTKLLRSLEIGKISFSSLLGYYRSENPRHLRFFNTNTFEVTDKHGTFWFESSNGWLENIYLGIPFNLRWNKSVGRRRLRIEEFLKNF